MRVICIAKARMHHMPAPHISINSSGPLPVSSKAKPYARKVKINANRYASGK